MRETNIDTNAPKGPVNEALPLTPEDETLIFRPEPNFTVTEVEIVHAKLAFWQRTMRVFIKYLSHDWEGESIAPLRKDEELTDQ